MAARIQILPEQLCNKIAAGEVVERPASVVKELVENALDAGAKQIHIDIEKGGKRLIRIVDDGCGMNRDDLFLCLERHATSKISSDEDLFRLQTLGFRGEAIPSIAAVSRMTLRSRDEQSEAGWEIYLEGGTVRRADAVGMPRGTTLEIQDLFYRMPARRKFLRRDETELGHVGEVVTKLALANPQVAFRLQHHGRALIDVPGHSRLQERIAALLGRTVLSELVEVDASAPHLHLQGLASQPTVHRATGGYIYTFVNGRYIRDRVVQHAILEAYRNLMPRGRYPVAVLFLRIDPELVDVNVHPTKHEVRFRQQSEVHDFLVAGLQDALRPSGWLHSGAPVSEAPPQPASGPEPDPPPSVSEQRQLEIREALGSYAARGLENLPRTGIAGSMPERHAVKPTAFEPGTCPPAPATCGFFSSLQLIGQFHNSYLLCQDDQDLVLIDQHAAHERIGFERLKRQWAAGALEQQCLLFPVMLEFSHQEIPQLQANLERLERFGFELEPFGGKSFALKAVPRVLGDGEATQLLRDLAAELAALGSSQALEAALDKILILIACHGMVRANQNLSPAEIRSLLHDLDQVDFGAQCPHGRPVMHRLSLADIERFFKRG